jgi:putative transposase
MDKDRIQRKAARSFKTSNGWSSRGYLPHFHREGVIQFITIRLADSLPRHVQNILDAELAVLKSSGLDPDGVGYQRCKRIETLLDAGYGSCSLRAMRVAEIVLHALRILEAEGNEIVRWVIMPNHIHLLIRVRSGASLQSVMRSFKGRTGKEANKILGTSGRFWFPEFFDRYIRDGEHLRRVIRYIDQNPVRAGLVRMAADWPFGSLGCSK